MRAGRAGSDDGYATVLAAGMIAVTVILLGLGAGLAGAVLARHRAESAADLAALAGASEAVSGTDTACGRASEVARANGADLMSCTWRGWTIAVGVRTSCSCLPSVAGSAVGRAQAGPITTDETPGRLGAVTPGDRTTPTSR